LLKGYYGILAYTFVRSEFKDKNGDYRPSSWDSRHIISLTGGKQLPKNWDVGFKFRYASGTPYTPFDVARSAQVAVWDVAQRGLPDYTQLNSERIPAFHQLDIRVDKKYFFPKWTLNVYLDVQNVYGFEIIQPPYLVLQRDASGQPILIDRQTYATKLLENTSGTVLPSIGIQVDF
ncbi:MAG: TonB-dependent receptor, partial [Hymenobacteraceae bacterium]|nr:TonB-dependent receptor [Hymenobacteraceae bacterium]MDX5396673.1 TonB-dependent receptor [Hymenobacteraceae bacterium]MDX5512736.1 TonB-dependent receptor [Hymenobacteraceae bacterium]